MHLDSIDRAILRTLQREAKIQNIELADRVGLSPSPCLRRVRLLEEAGVIEGYSARVSAQKVGYDLTFFARVWVTGPHEDTIAAFIDAVSKLPEVVEIHMMAGDYDFLLKIVAADLDAYRRFRVERLGRIPCIRDIKSDIPMQNVKQSWELPL
ncbi:MAG: Lrp/AsnC family transcriptional regulator [Rhodobacteraceae bacterium]|jgi:Lrp/AsnC family leucine-responsive transcriptional regulator|nr:MULTISPECIES: Lrp/AsnC family transcriptional regulator [Rhodobacterales]MAB09094.1 Lrp/AsnC family transcriptional regulator [Paracoccaceae bacterium]MBY5971393.1 Lrp/AsnC family transcriptional regulator [Ferrimonas balearica]MCT4577548.1 Lrp/AsnC family transcriptional regulator [Donghicola sp.]MDE4099694.1 Lrp/AsnC family transcriptional regulator [Phaeobacter gallaeciensis]MDE4108406.1 Lrp/AsnC family transcriptional regulator [Phaeobacter gallaeciensis]|tara:strand:+ start:11857 stop:12315 length:459 start_codon:yes stop_codon:yes gene_type:complete